MTSLRDGKIWCIWVFWGVYVHSTLYETYYIWKKHDGTSQETKEPLYSVLEHNLVSCGVTCGTHGKCVYFVYSRHNKRCRGYSDDLCDDGRHDKTAVDVMHQHTCMKRCPRNTSDELSRHDMGTHDKGQVNSGFTPFQAIGKQTTYKLTFTTGSRRDSDSGANLTVGILGPCGRVGVTLENGKDVRLQKGRRSTFTFVDDSVCGPKAIDLAFSNLCHRDDWFVANVLVEYKDMATGDRDRVKFKTNYWLSATEEQEHTTGISCYHMFSAGILSSILENTECHPSQKCEH